MSTKFVRIYNPESGMFDDTVLAVETFTVQAVFVAMEKRNWYFQDGTYVAILVSGPEKPARYEIHGDYATCLTFTVQNSERIVTERIAVPA